MNCARYQATMEGSSSEVFEQICFVILDICQKNQTKAFDDTRDQGMEKLFDLAQPVFASIQHTCSGGLEQSAHASTLFMASISICHYFFFAMQFDTPLQKVAFIHGAAPWLRSLEDGTTFDVNLRVSAYSKNSGSDHNRITVELASDQASAVMFISTCGDVFKNSLSKNDVTEFDSVDLDNVAVDGASFPMFCFNSERSQADKSDLSKTNEPNLYVVAFAGANDCCSGTRLINEFLIACRHALSYICTQSRFQVVVGGFHSLQNFCHSFLHDDCTEHRISPSSTEMSFSCLKSTVQLPLPASFYTHNPVTFNQIASIWISARIASRAYFLDSKFSLESMPHPASLDALMKGLSEHSSGIFGSKKASGTLLNVLAETSNKRQIVQKQDLQSTSHTMIRRKSVGGTNASMLSPRVSTSTSKTDRRTTMMKGSSIITGMPNIDFTDVRQSFASAFQKQFITRQSRTSIQLTKGLTNKNAPKLRILTEQKCAFTNFAQDFISGSQEISSAVISISQKFIILTIGTYLHCVEIELVNHLHTKSIFQKNMLSRVRILCSCEDSTTIFLAMSDGRLICFKDCCQENGTGYECSEFETCIDQCSVCSLLVHREWINICGSEGSQNVDYVRFKLESGSVIANSGHGFPLRLSSSVTAVQFHLFDHKVLCPFVFCGLCNSDIEIWGKIADEDFYLMQCLQNRTSGLGAINSICSVGKDTIAVGHDGGYIHFWSIEISSNSASYLDRQFSISSGSEGLPHSFHIVSTDKFSEDRHQNASQLFVVNEHHGNSVILHSETGVLLHTFSVPLFPPHILHQFSGQSNPFVTVFELCALCIEGSCLRRLVFQLQYVSSDQTSLPTILATSANIQRGNSQVHSLGNFDHEQLSEAKFDGDQIVRTFTPTHCDGRHFSTSESFYDSSKEFSMPMASRNYLSSATASSANDFNLKLAELSSSQCLPELLHTESAQPKASGIMIQLLSRRSCQDDQDSSTTSMIQTESANIFVTQDKKLDTTSCIILRPQTRLPAKLVLQPGSSETEFEQHLILPHQLHQGRVPRSHLPTKSKESDEPGLHGANLVSTSSYPHFHSPRGPCISNLPKKMPSPEFYDPTRVRLLPTASNPIGRIHATGSDLRPSFASYHAQDTEIITAIQNDTLHSHRPHPLLVNFDPLTFNLRSRKGLLSLADPLLKYNQCDLDSNGGISSSDSQSLLRAVHQPSSASIGELHVGSQSVRLRGRLPKKLQ
jgi:hypothetical protein